MTYEGLKVRDSPEEAVEAEHGEHDGHVAQDAHRVAQLVDQQEPLVDHPEEHRNTRLSSGSDVEPVLGGGWTAHLGVLQDSGLRVALKMT